VNKLLAPQRGWGHGERTQKRKGQEVVEKGKNTQHWADWGERLRGNGGGIFLVPFPLPFRSLFSVSFCPFTLQKQIIFLVSPVEFPQY